MLKTIEVIPGLFILITVGITTLLQALLRLCSEQSLLNLCILGGIIVYGSSTVFHIVFLLKFSLSIVCSVVIGSLITFATIASLVVSEESGKSGSSSLVGNGIATK